MKILLPLSGRVELALSAAAAVLIHAAALGLGLGSLERAPAPRLQQVDRSETVCLAPPAPRRREPVKKTPRERVERVKERVCEKSAPAERRPAEKRVAPLREPLVKAKATPEVRRLRVPEPVVKRIPVRAKTVRERAERPLEAEGVREQALIRTAAPSVKRGFAFTYPRYARLMGYEGKVTLRVTVSAQGKVTAVEVERSSGYRILDESAVRQVKALPFSPALDARGRTVESTVLQTVNFDIREGKGAEYGW